MTKAALEQEWLLLQKQHEHYEFAALALKGLAVALTAWAGATGLAVALLLVLWLQEGIVKTFQARLGERLLRVEQGLRDGLAAPMQLHADWQAARRGTVGLLGEYARSACRPTVAFPYALLVLLKLVF